MVYTCLLALEATITLAFTTKNPMSLSHTKPNLSRWSPIWTNTPKVSILIFKLKILESVFAPLQSCFSFSHFHLILSLQFDCRKFTFQEAKKIAFKNARPLGCVPKARMTTKMGGSCDKVVSTMAREQYKALYVALKKLESTLLGIRIQVFNIRLLQCTFRQKSTSL